VSAIVIFQGVGKVFEEAGIRGGGECCILQRNVRVCVRVFTL